MEDFPRTRNRLGVLRLRLVGWVPGAVHRTGSTCCPNFGVSLHTFREWIRLFRL
jgi:hypothetical protein